MTQPLNLRARDMEMTADGDQAHGLGERARLLELVEEMGRILRG